MELHKNSNRLLEYIDITDWDNPIGEYIDFLGFYWKFNEETLSFFYRDNWDSQTVAWFFVSAFPMKRICLKVSYFYKANKKDDWKIIEIAQIMKTSIDGHNVLKVVLYGKGILILNRCELWDNLEDLLAHFWLRKVVLTRIDYTVDCSKVNRRKKVNLKSKKKNTYKNLWTNKTEYVAYGSKNVSPHFIRIYDKKEDLKKSKYEWLYPEYIKYENVHRYELQVNSDWIHQDDKVKSIYDIRYIINFEDKVKKEKRDHHQHKIIDKDRKFVESIINKYKKERNRDKIWRIFAMIQGAIIQMDM